MKVKYLLSACLLLSGLASCTSDEIVPNGGGIDGNVPGHGAVVFSISGLGTGSVENPETRATVLATAEENRIDSLDIYVFAFDNDGVFNEDLTSNAAADMAKLTPQADGDVTDQTKWYLQEKWTYKSQEPGRSTGLVDTSKPQLHEIPTLGGSGVARTAVIYPQQGRCLKFFIVANGGELTATDADTPWTPAFTDAAAATVGTKASDFLALRLRLGLKPADADQVLPINCPLPMTAQMATTTAEMVNMVGSNAPAQATRPATLTRAVTRFDVVNYAALPSQGDYTLTDVYVTGHYAFTDMTNLVPAGETLKAPVKHNLDGRTWTPYTDIATGDRAMILASVFYTSPTLAGTDPMQLGLRGVLGKSTAKPGELLTPLNKDVKVVDGAGDPIVLKANYRYLLNIKKLGSDINVIFSVIDWDSKILDADFSNAPMPKLIWENAQGITWNVADTDMNKHFVEMANTAVGGRLAFELGTYTEDELADLLIDPTNPAKIPFDVQVLSLNDNPAFQGDNIWLATPVITFDPVKRDRFNVVLDIRPEAEVPLQVRPDLLVTVTNKEHTEKQLFFRVTSTWQAPAQPENTIVTLDNITVETNNNPADSWQAAVNATPANRTMPTEKNINKMAGIKLTSTPQTVTVENFFKAFPDRSEPLSRAVAGTRYWLADEAEAGNAKQLVVSGKKVSIVSASKSDNARTHYVTVGPVAPVEYPVGDYTVLTGGSTDGDNFATFADAQTNIPAGYQMPTKSSINYMAGVTINDMGVTVTNADFKAAFPDTGDNGLYGTWYWLGDASDDVNAAWCLVAMGSDYALLKHEVTSAAIKVRYVKGRSLNGHAAENVNGTWVVSGAPAGTDDADFGATFKDAMKNIPAGWSMPDKANVNTLAGVTIDEDGVTVTNADFKAAFPDTGDNGLYGTWYWLGDASDVANAAWCLVAMGSDYALMKHDATSTAIKVRYIKK